MKWGSTLSASRSRMNYTPYAFRATGVIIPNATVIVKAFFEKSTKSQEKHIFSINEKTGLEIYALYMYNKEEISVIKQTRKDGDLMDGNPAPNPTPRQQNDPQHAHRLAARTALPV